MKTIIVMLGVPGSGRTELAKELSEQYEAEIITDDAELFTLGSGVFSPDQVDSRAGCLANFDKAIREDRSVIVDNDNSQWRDIKPFIFGALYKGYDLIIQEPHTGWKYIAEECFQHSNGKISVEKLDEMIKNVQLTRARCRRVMDALFDRAVKYEDHGIRVVR